jgi:hypothetical protein
MKKELTLIMAGEGVGKSILAGGEIMAGDGGYQEFPLSELRPSPYRDIIPKSQDDLDVEWFTVRGHWLIRKVPNTKDQFYVKCGNPPARVLEIYGITK